MKGTHVRVTRSGAATMAMALSLGGCLSGTESETSPWTGDVTRAVTVSGSVGDGPVVNSAVSVRSISGESLASFTSDISGSYEIDLVANSNQYPLLIDASGGRDIVTDTPPDFVMLSAVPGPGSSVTANANPFSTLAVETARDMSGGLTRDNLLFAENLVLASSASGLTMGSPVRTRIGAENISQIVKSSETLAEVVRRTRDALSAAGENFTGDAIMQTLGSDLVDGVIEGGGGPRANPHVSAVAIVVAADVLLDAMVNELHVNGRDITADMQRAIEQVMSRPVSPGLEDLPVTPEMIGQASVGLSAAYAVTDDSRIFGLLQAVESMQPGLKPALVRTMMPANFRGALAEAIRMAASGDETVIATINSVARSGLSEQPGENRAPSISGRPPSSVRVGSTYDFTPTVSDLDGDVVLLSIEGEPAWLTFDTSTGRLSGTPLASDAGRYDGIVIKASDGNLESSLGPFSITVTVDNSAPTIRGTASTSVGVGEAYSFQPQASDPDGDTLQFSISGMPSWARFTPTTGRLSGTPAAVNVGIYPDIVITVSDGSLNASLAAFSIEVTDDGAATGSVTLNWTPPTENEDGSQLMDLAGYRLYWGRDGGVLGNSVTISNPSVTRYVVENLTPGSYEFAATALNTAGIESRFSNGITMVVQ